MENSENNKSKPKWSLLFWIGAIFCFVIFPVFLLDVGLDSYINTKNESERREAYRILGINLEKILQYSDAKHYYHSLLSTIFDIAEKEKDSLGYLKRAIHNLKEKNPGAFSFVVWDNKDDSIIESLTDEKGHRYILKALNEIFVSLTKENNDNYPVKTENNVVLSKKFNIIRSYIGNLVVAEAFLEPLLKANLGKIVPTSFDKNKAFFWFKSTKKYTVFVNVSKSKVESLEYVEKLVKAINKVSRNGIKFGMNDLFHEKSIIPEENEVLKAEINLALAKYENYSYSKLETNSFIILLKVLNPFSRVFCYIPKSNVYKNQNLKNNTLVIATLVILLFFLGLWILYRFTNYNFSMRWKLSLLFLYANGLPLMALAFIGYDYLEQNRNIQLEEAYDSISQYINDFDSKFGIIKEEFANKINSIIDEINSEYSKTNVLNRKYYNEIINEISKMEYKDYNFIDSNGNVVIGSNNKIDNSVFKNLGQNILVFINNATYTPLVSFKARKLSNDKYKYDSFYKNAIFFDTVIAKKGTISCQQILNDVSYYYVNFIGNNLTRDFKELCLISWETRQLQENYIRLYLDDLNSNSRNINCLAFSEKYGKVFPDSKYDKDLLSRFRQILNLKSLKIDKFYYNNNYYVAFGLVGKDLDQIALLGYIPLEIINKKVNKNKLRLFIFIIISMTLTLGISWLLSAYFLSPIKVLDNGIDAMRRQDFAYRLPINSADEFGSLNQVFNNALISLEDLSVATTVQENLFPLEALKHNRAIIWGKSVAMTRLGGDYFDYFPLNDKEVGILMGDVAGHGVPAGFLMAMAKASVLLSEDDKKDPSKLLTAVHKVFYHVKSKKIKRMMTCVYFCLNTETGAFLMANAGHCYPAIINDKGQIKFLEIDGTPLGITKRSRYTNTEGILENNSYILLYTDGMLEAHNDKGESIGINRFSQLVSDSFSEDPEVFYNQIFSGYKKWSPLADDDITMVLVKFGFGGLYSNKLEIVPAVCEVKS
ncbi:MAG: SpoIIE family protein phosphatase [Candidatus Riflebacteria bacterium]|nr:SpoIIE family protein phosphatase [Candidatus Riflebacteria bacterium]